MGWVTTGHRSFYVQKWKEREANGKTTFRVDTTKIQTPRFDAWNCVQGHCPKHITWEASDKRVVVFKKRDDVWKLYHIDFEDKE